MKKLKILISILVIIVIFIGVTLLLIKNKNKTSKEIILTPEDKVGYTINPIDDAPKDIDIKESFGVVSGVADNSQYFTVKALTINYICYFMSGNKTEIQKVLSPSFVKQYKINEKNVLSISNIPRDEKMMNIITIMNMKEFSVDSETKVYIVKGKVRMQKDNKVYDFSILIETKMQDKLYCIYPEKYIIDKGFDKLKIGEIIKNYKVEKIENIKDNKYIDIEEKNDKEMASEYFSDFKERILYYSDSIYDMLDNNYSQNRFGNKEAFYSYLEENKIRINLSYINKYKVIKKDTYIDYICSDMYNNIYTFRQKGENIMDYTVFLDNYTIVSEKDEKYYNDSDKKTKAKINLNKIIAMINTKDYKAIYKNLNNEFKNNSFKNIRDIKTYIQNNFYEINNIELKNIEEKDNYYAFECKLINQRNINENKNVSIIISKTDDTNFTMSFGFE